MARLPRALAPLHQPSFRLLVGGQLTSSVGDAFYAVALPWYVLSAKGGPLLLGGVLAAYGVARTLLLAVGGQASDRWGPWTVMMEADALRAIALASLVAAVVAGPADVYLLVPVSAVIGAGEGLFLPASLAIVPSLVPGEELEAGNAITEGGAQLAMLVGPAIGGVVVALAGAAPAFVADAVSFVISASTLWGIRARRTPLPTAALRSPPVGSEQAPVAARCTGEQLTVRDEVPPAPAPTLRSLVASERALQVVLVVVVAANLGAGGMGEVALPALAHGPLDAGAGGYGALLAAFAGGALIGTLAAAQVRRVRRPAAVASAGFLIEAGCLAAVPYLGGVTPAAAALAGFGALNGFGNIIVLTAIQRFAPRALLGRLMALLMFAALGVFPVSVLTAGFVVQRLGPALFFPLAGALLAVAIAVSLTQSSWRRFGSPGHAAQPEPVSSTAS